MTEAENQSATYAFSITVLTRAMEAGEEVMGSGATVLLRRFGKPVSRILLGSERFERSGTVDLQKAAEEAKRGISDIKTFGDTEIQSAGGDVVSLIQKGCLRRIEEYGKNPGGMKSCILCMGLIESFFRDATGNSALRATLDRFDNDNCYISVKQWGSGAGAGPAEVDVVDIAKAFEIYNFLLKTFAAKADEKVFGGSKMFMRGLQSTLTELKSSESGMPAIAIKNDFSVDAPGCKDSKKLAKYMNIAIKSTMNSIADELNPKVVDGIGAFLDKEIHTKFSADAEKLNISNVLKG
ncbi:MAG: hypothetical protein JW778_00490 [Candidatus Altiarchaeota archaeon]|nr:hypothetical protein [Candidatus Altiarchaeota archaeon]